MIPDQAAAHILMSLFDESSNKTYSDKKVVLSWCLFAVMFNECEKYTNTNTFKLLLKKNFWDVWTVFYFPAAGTHNSFTFLLLPANGVSNPDVKRSLHCLNSFNFTINKCLPGPEGKKKIKHLFAHME